jgi:DNA-binding XRE family transcriptional regulator
MQLALVLKMYRRSRQLTQKEVAALFGISREYYCRLESGKGKPSISLLETICRSTDIAVESIFGDDAEMNLRGQLNELCKLCLRLRSPDRKKVQWLIKRMLKR